MKSTVVVELVWLAACSHSSLLRHDVVAPAESKDGNATVPPFPHRGSTSPLLPEGANRRRRAPAVEHALVVDKEPPLLADATIHDIRRVRLIAQKIIITMSESSLALSGVMIFGGLIVALVVVVGLWTLGIFVR
eukprot:GEMP01131654.1.p1 GENE.GEMP01131654.1~~GEMP01131654.1.p1  ORF type:complete len:134 (+),score=29.42 GEMP01131654.1:36-437(+)